MLFLARVENVTNGQTHIGGWVENVTNGRTHRGKNRHEHTECEFFDGLTKDSHVAF